MCTARSSFSNIVRYIVQVALGLVAFIPCSHAELRFEALTACSDIARLYEVLRSNPAARPSSCGQARSSFEQAIVERSGLQSDQLCFLERPPADFLAGYTCVQSHVGTAAELVCFRAASSNDVHEYKEQYKDKFAAPVSHYLREASACSASNGDSAAAARTLFPTLLSFVSRYEFGFILGLGKETPIRSSVLHGYATVDATIDNNDQQAIEFVYLLVSASDVKSEVRKNVGNWIVSIDNSDEFESGFTAEFRRGHIPVFVDFTFFAIERARSAVKPIGTKLDLIADWQQVIAHTLEEEYFEVVSDDDLHEKTGMISKDIIATISRNQPFGHRDDSPIKFGSQLTIMINESRPVCTRNDNGATVASIFSIQPVPQVVDDYGGVVLGLLGLGACGKRTGPTKTFVEELIKESTTQLFQIMEKK
jgi:hypothetical protein